MSIYKKIRERIIKEQRMPTYLSFFINSNFFVRRELFRAIKRNLHYMKGETLDFGCGIKPYKNLFINADSITGVDIENEGHTNDVSEVDVFYDGNTLPFDNERFDSIFSSEVLTHIHDLEPVIKELYRVLKKNGKILLTVPFVWHENEAPNDAIRFTSFGIAEMLKRHGFSIIKSKKCGHYLKTVFQMWNAYLFQAVFPNVTIIKIMLTFLIIFPMHILESILLLILPKNKELFNNIIVIAEK